MSNCVRQTQSATILLMFIVFFSCGKNIEDRPSQENQFVEGTTSEVIADALKVQDLKCSNSSKCPSYVAKISIFSQDRVKFCQGTLINSDTVVTSANCLPSWLRFAGAKCETSVIFTYQGRSREKKSFKCLRIDSASTGIFRRTTELWDNDIAILKMKSKTNRKPIKLTEDGIFNSKKLTRWSLDVESLKLATIKKDRCRKLLNSYANPFADNVDSSMQLISECGKETRVPGAALLNKYNRFVAVQSVDLDEKIVRSLSNGDLLSESVADIFHVSNLACTSVRLNNYELKPKGCFGVKNFYELDRRRSLFLNETAVHKKNIDLLEAKLSRSEKYFKWNFKFVPIERSHSLKMQIEKPTCYFGVDEWIEEYRRGNSILTPARESFIKNDYILKTKLNKFLKSTSVIENLGEKKFKFKFNPFTAYVKKYRYTYVAFKLGPKGKGYPLRFENIKECR